MRLFAAVLLLLALAMSPADADDSDGAEAAARIAARMVHAPVLRADFHQERIMQALSRPLVTRGRIVAVAGSGVLWQVIQPQPATVLMSADGIVEWDEAGTPRRTGTEGIPVFRALADVLAGALSGDTSGLAALFEVEPADMGPEWRLILRPRDTGLARVISTVEIAGADFVEEAVIAEAGGDKTIIRFSGFTLEPAVLDDAEKRYFAP